MATDDKQATENCPSSEHLIQRSSVRYIRKDLKVYLTRYRLFSSSPLKTKLIDISSRGVQVATTIRIRIKKKLLVNIYFPDGYKFEINGKIVRCKQKQSHLYDLKFETLDHYIEAENVTFERVYLLVSKAPVKNKYRNITSHSIQMLTDEKINNKSKLILAFEFSNGDRVERNADIIRYRCIAHNYYGIKFDERNPLLGNYLIKTQKALIFSNNDQENIT